LSEKRGESERGRRAGERERTHGEERKKRREGREERREGGGGYVLHLFTKTVAVRIGHSGAVHLEYTLFLFFFRPLFFSFLSLSSLLFFFFLFLFFFFSFFCTCSQVGNAPWHNSEPIRWKQFLGTNR
jgi:hypothetical protein